MVSFQSLSMQRTIHSTKKIFDWEFDITLLCSSESLILLLIHTHVTLSKFQHTLVVDVLPKSVLTVSAGPQKTAFTALCVFFIPVFPLSFSSLLSSLLFFVCLSPHLTSSSWQTTPSVAFPVGPADLDLPFQPVGLPAYSLKEVFLTQSVILLNLSTLARLYLRFPLVGFLSISLYCNESMHYVTTWLKGHAKRGNEAA